MPSNCGHGVFDLWIYSYKMQEVVINGMYGGLSLYKVSRPIGGRIF